VVVPAGRSGYIQAIQPELLIRAAVKCDSIVRLARQVGDRVVEGTPLAWAWPQSADRTQLDPRLLWEALSAAVNIGVERTMVQDVSFGLRRLVDIGNKALSPATNDPYTGIQALHHLSVLLCMLAARRLGDRLYYDEQRALRLAVPLPRFADYLGLGTDQLRRSGVKEPAVACSLVQLFRDVGGNAISDDRRGSCAHHIWLVLEDAKREIAQPADAEPVLADGAAALTALGAGHTQIADG
jgi:uncharacterized membrane protein